MAHLFAMATLKSKDIWYIVDIVISLMWFSSAYIICISNSDCTRRYKECSKSALYLERLRIGCLSKSFVRLSINIQYRRLDWYHLSRCFFFSTNVSAIAFFSSFVKHKRSLFIIVSNIVEQNFSCAILLD